MSHPLPDDTTTTWGITHDDTAAAAESVTALEWRNKRKWLPNGDIGLNKQARLADDLAEYLFED